ncbi:hypothetical protein Tco_1574371 [Tanacetum coccineum]
MKTVPCKDYILLPLWPADLPLSQNLKSSLDAGFKPSVANEKKVTKEPGKEGGDSNKDQEKEDDNVNSTNNICSILDIITQAWMIGLANYLESENPHAHTFLDHDTTSQSYGSCVVGHSIVMMSLLGTIKCEHWVVN